MRTSKIRKIEEIRNILDEPPEPPASYWLFENDNYLRYNLQSDTWEPSTFEIMQSEANKKSQLFISGDDQIPTFKGRIMTIVGKEEQRQHLIRCHITPDEIEARLKDHPTARELADNMIKLITGKLPQDFINT